MSPIEILAVALGLANILLLVRRSIWNYPFGIAMVCLYGWIFFEQKLYSDALLQIFFLVLNLYGWLNWSAARGDGDVPVRRISPVLGATVTIGAAVAIIGWGTLMHRNTDAAYPYWDGAIAMISIAAQALQAWRFVACWALWILVDLLAIPLYWTKDLHATAALYAVFLALSLVGLLQWRRALHRQ